MAIWTTWNLSAGLGCFYSTPMRGGCSRQKSWNGNSKNKRFLQFGNFFGRFVWQHRIVCKCRFKQLFVDSDVAKMKCARCQYWPFWLLGAIKKSWVIWWSFTPVSRFSIVLYWKSRYHYLGSAGGWVVNTVASWLRGCGFNSISGFPGNLSLRSEFQCYTMFLGPNRHSVAILVSDKKLVHFISHIL